MKKAVATIAIFTGAVLFSLIDTTPAAHADPYGGPGECQYLGQNYNFYYPCTQYQPWLPYGTAHNPPLGGSAVLPGDPDGTSGTDCPACSS